MGRARRLLQVAIVVMLTGSIGYLAAARRGLVPSAPRVLAAVVAALLVLLAWEGVLAARLLARGQRVAAAGKLAVIVGMLAIGAGGLANWLLSLQGFIVLTEGDVVPLFGGRHLQVLEAGPLANLGEMDVFIELGPVKLRPDSDGGFYPEVRLVIARQGEQGKLIELRRDQGAASGSLRFHRGAFGFAPRLVVTRGDKTLLDESIPFTTRREGDEIVFEGEARIADEDLVLMGMVSLDSLDERMKGHPLLVMAVSKEGKAIGEGHLRIGHFADVPGGYRVGFAGLKKWVEIDLSRRNYPAPVLGGAALALAGGLVWGVGRWRRR